MNEIVEAGNQAPATTHAGANIEALRQIVALSTNPDVDEKKLGALLGYQERIMDRVAMDAHAAAKNNAMVQMPKIDKNSVIEHNGKIIGRYKKYEDLRKLIDPVLEQYNLRVWHRPGFNEAMKMPTVECMLTYAKDGVTHTEAGGPMVIPFETSGAKNATQGAGSSQTYGQRYTLCAMLGIVLEGVDDDGNQGQLSHKGNQDEQQNELLHQCRLAASHGTAAYQKYYKDDLTNLQRAWLVDSGEHEKLKASAAEHD